MLLSELQNGEFGIISKVRGRGAFRKRIIEMGFIRGKRVTVIKNAPLKDPIEYSIMGYEVSLRRSEAHLIEIITPEEAVNLTKTNYNGVLAGQSENDILTKGAKEGGKIVNVALVGNPNAGKTTLFNYASGAHAQVGNYSGVTVDSKLAHFKHKGFTFNITDLPGTYSLSAYTPEELYVRRFIHEQKPDVVINVLDASNIERNLYLTTQLIDMDIKVVVALNMFDELQAQGDKFNFKDLGRMIGIPMVPTVGSKGKGIPELFDTVINVFTDKDKTLRHIHLNYGEHIERSIEAIQIPIKKERNNTLNVHYSSRYLAIKLLEKDRQAHRILSKSDAYTEITNVTNHQIKKLEEIYKDDSETLITDAKYGFIAGALKETYVENPNKKKQGSQSIDNFITHKYFGFPIFLLFMWFSFYTTFKLGAYPMDWIDQGVSLLSAFLDSVIPTGAFKDLLIGGIVSGVGSVIVFLPNILLLFLFLSILEDTGYMARAVFIMDKLMHKIGLHGKSFIPLIMGFGCNVPAIMATRTIENRNNRLVTILINPFMSCSARLPVYILILGAFFPKHAGSLLFLIYLIGIVMAIILAILFKKTIFKGEDIPFVMELPPYRIPTLKSTIRHMWFKASQYLKKMGGVILVAVIIIWALEYFPKGVNYSQDFEQQLEQVNQQISRIEESTPNSLMLDSIKLSLTGKLFDIENQMVAERQANSYLGRIGNLIEPVIRPLGFDWKMGVSLLSGIAAKEIVVSTLGVLVQAGDDSDETSQTLIHKLQDEVYTYGPKVGQKVYTPISAFSFLLFILIYFPCVAVIAAIKKEAGNWKWAAFTIFYTTSLAWIVSFLFYQIGSFFY
ncbi:MAG: ferrous iron transport protein B [Tenuifilaceae bacterium]|jgi:ferrous iron transport protein B|nr:ferrous iron transport protein B [Tenuifilaceae bacterium]